MIYIKVDMSEASQDEQEKVRKHLDTFDSSMVYVSYEGSNDKIDQLKERLCDRFREKRLQAGNVFNQQDQFHLNADLSFDASEKKIMGDAFRSFVDEGFFIFDEAKGCLRLTDKGERSLYG